jgi:hypothetical protein
VFAQQKVARSVSREVRFDIAEVDARIRDDAVPLPHQRGLRQNGEILERASTLHGGTDRGAIERGVRDGVPECFVQATALHLEEPPPRPRVVCGQLDHEGSDHGAIDGRRGAHFRAWRWILGVRHGSSS